MADQAYIDGRLVMDSKQDLVDEIERLRGLLDELVSHIEATGQHSPQQRDEHYVGDCPICEAMTEAVAALHIQKQSATK